MKKLKVIAAGLVIGALAGVSYEGYKLFTKPVVVKVVGPKIDRTLELTTEVTEYSAGDVLRKLPKDMKKTLLTLSSPGGDVDAGKHLEAEVRYRNVDTYVPVMAASMAAQLFMEGERRYVEPDALILFHSVANGLGRPDQVGEMLKLLDSDIIKTYLGGSITGDEVLATLDSAECKEHMSKLLKILSDIGSVIETRDTLETIKNHMDMINEAGMFVFDKLISKKLTKERLLAIYGNFKKNKFITGKELFELGIATHLGHPNMADYGEQ